MKAKTLAPHANPGSTPVESPAGISIKKILVPLDFSAHSRAVFNYAITLAARFQSEIVLLHVFEPVVPELKVLEGAFAGRGFREEAAKELARWRRRVPRDLAVSAELHDGKHAYHEILAAAEQHNVDLIVIGRSGHTGLERVLVGSTVNRVLKKARCPVFVTT